MSSASVYRRATHSGRNYDVTLERVEGEAVRIDVLGADAEGRRIAHLQGEAPADDLGLVAQLVGAAVKDAARRWPGIKAPPAYTLDDLRRVHRNSHKRWTDEEDALLVERVGQGATVKELVAEFGRNRNAIDARAARLGVTLN